jgi:hypothetical protein
VGGDGAGDSSRRWLRVWREYGTVVGRGPGGSRKNFTTSGGPLVFGGPTLKLPKIMPTFGGWLIFGGCVHNF